MENRENASGLAQKVGDFALGFGKGIVTLPYTVMTVFPAGREIDTFDRLVSNNSGIKGAGYWIGILTSVAAIGRLVYAVPDTGF